MSEQEILNAIADACGDRSLHFQIIMQDDSLHIYINRPTQLYLDYPQLKRRIYDAVMTLPTVGFRQVWLYCRVLGQVEPDWQSVLEIETNSSALAEMTSMVETISSVVDATDSIVSKIERELEISESFIEDPQIDFEDLPTTASDEPELFNLSESELAELLEDSFPQIDLSQYCFIRNRRLLYAVLDEPWLNIARLIHTFDRFTASVKRSQLPILEAYFEGAIELDPDNFEPEVQNWWREIKQLDLDNKHKMAIWLSRYCLDPHKTVITVREVILAKANLIKPEIKQSEPEKPHADSSLNSEPQLPSQPNCEQNQDNPEVNSGLLASLGELWQKLWRIKF